MSTSDSPTSEGSGLADLRSIAASIGVPSAKGPGQPDGVDFEPESGAVLLAPSAAPPSALASTPLLASPSPLQSTLLQPPPPTAAARQAERSRRGLIWALAGSGVVLLGAVAFLGLRATTAPAPHAAQAQATTPPAPALAAVATDPAPPAQARPAAPPPPGLAQGLAQGLAGAAVAPEELEDEASTDLILDDDPTRPAGRRRSRSRATSGAPAAEGGATNTQPQGGAEGVADPFAAAGTTPSDPATNPATDPNAQGIDPGADEDPNAATEAAAPTQAPARDGLSAECVLDPNRPECAGKVPDRPKQVEGPSDDANLPQKLTSIDVRKGFAKVKPAAKACGRTHGVSSGTKVKVKVSIEGTSGKVISAKAIGDFADSPVGTCVSDALRGAEFPRFRAKQMGLTYPVIL